MEKLSILLLMVAQSKEKVKYIGLNARQNPPTVRRSLFYSVTVVMPLVSESGF